MAQTTKQVVRELIRERLRWARYRKNLTQEQLAQKTKLSTNYIAHLERGSRMPSVDVLITLGNVLGVNPADFLVPLPAGPRKEIQRDLAARAWGRRRR
jgi:transcriptional regulator with XRE-family HTH domain